MKQFLKNDESGAIIVEATIALSVFVFAIFTMLSVVNICYIQARIGSALASSTKEVSQYSYLYYKFALDKLQAEIHERNEDTRAEIDNTITGVETLMDSLSEVGTSDNLGDYEAMIEAAAGDISDMEGLFQNFQPELNDPANFIVGLATLAGEELGEGIKNVMGQFICYAFMQKNLKDSPADTPDLFLRRYNIVDGLDGLSFNGSSLMSYGVSNEIQMVVTYKIQVVRLLGIDVQYTIRQCAKSSAWGNGITQIEEEDDD